MKKCIAIFVSAVLLLTLTSCLRDATPTAQQIEITDMVSMQTTGPEVSVTEPVTVPVTLEPEKEPHAEVLKWTSIHADPTSVLMTLDEIEAENLRIDQESESVTDILNVPGTLSRDELHTLISKHDVPTLPRYDKDGSEITNDHAELVRANMAEDLIKDENPVLLGIVTSRANVRAVPDDKPYRKTPDNPYDSIQQTELCVGAPVWVLHSDREGEYFFVRSYNYFGWVKTTNIAVTGNDTLWRSFADPKSFVCVTDTLVNVGGEYIDMGARLPLVSASAGGYTVILPRRNADGRLVSDNKTIKRTSASEGYLPYTYENFVTQAFKYEGTMYGWGGLDNGVDCSGFVSNVFKCFGFILPRDTDDQNSVVGDSLNVSGWDHNDISEYLLSVTSPTVVYYPGHTLLYLGYSEEDGEFYFIHAPQIGETVSVTSKSDLSKMTYIGVVDGDTEM